MNRMFHVLALAAALGAGVAQAQEATLFRGDPGFQAQSPIHRGEAPGADPTLGRVTVVGSRELMRREVLAELAVAMRSGSFDRSGDATPVVYEPWNSTLTREAVLAEVARARANGTFDTSGEHWIGQERVTTVAARADRQLVAVKR